SRRRHTRFSRDWSSDVCSSDLQNAAERMSVRASLGQSVADLEADLFKRLNEPRRRPWHRTDPELVRVWGRIMDELGEIQFLLERSEERRVGKECRSRGARSRDE